MLNFQSHLKKLCCVLEEKGLDGFLLINIESSDSANLQYLTGFSGSFGILFVTKKQQLLMTDSRYIERVKQELEDLKIHQIKGKWAEEVAQVLGDFKGKLAINSLSTTIHTKGELEKALDKIELIIVDGLVEELRQGKDAEEIELTRRSVEITDRAFSHILGQLKPGVSEREVAWELEVYIRQREGAELAFPSIVASGPNSALPHAAVSDRKLEKGDLILFDFGARYRGYCSDMTRVVALGEATAKQREIYEIVLKAQQTAIDHLKAGITCKEADQFARDVIVKAGWGENFGHGLGHGVGLEVHESPRLSPLSSDKDLLKQGMVVTVEPGIYIPGWGGVRIEDLVVIKEESCYVLTRSEKKLLVI